MQQLLTTTLELIKAENPCADGFETLKNYLGADYPEDKPINLLTILASNGTFHCLWALRATQQDSRKISRLIVSGIAELVLPIYEKKYPEDDRPRKAIKAARDYANELIDADTLNGANLNALKAAMEAEGIAAKATADVAAAADSAVTYAYDFGYSAASVAFLAAAVSDTYSVAAVGQYFVDVCKFCLSVVTAIAVTFADDYDDYNDDKIIEIIKRHLLSTS